jgi:hypothetical protein
MRRLSIGIIDLIANAPKQELYPRLFNAGFASLMPQVIAVWCEQAGHHVTFITYTGSENLSEELPDQTDLVFISAYTEGAQLAYALSNLLRSKGTVTALGGPHARCYPRDALQYFDYVFGFTDKTLICDLLHDSSRQRPIGVHLCAARQPTTLPGVVERWKFIAPTLSKSRFIKIVPMLGSVGCPYTCSFCIDSTVPYQAFPLETIKEDLRFLVKTLRRPCVGWQDPNFGVRFNDYLDAIEEAVPPNSVSFLGEASLSLLSESRLERLKRNGFKAILPGVESWYDMGEKSNTGTKKGIDKVRQVSEHVNLIVQYIPYVQVNFVFGLDSEDGPAPFEFTKRFVDMTPGAFPGYSLLCAYGQAAPLNVEYQRANRVLPLPFHILNSSIVTNVKPKNYSWTEFYDRFIDLMKYTTSWRANLSRCRAIDRVVPRLVLLLRAISYRGTGRIKHYTKLRQLLDNDAEVRDYFEQRTDRLPVFYVQRIRKDLGPFWHWLPEGALYHDPNAYMKSETAGRKRSHGVERRSTETVA